MAFRISLFGLIWEILFWIVILCKPRTSDSLSFSLFDFWDEIEMYCNLDKSYEIKAPILLRISIFVTLMIF